jgi:hypothetical protein
MPNGDILGEELYQQRARRVLPILIKQAELRKEISYSALAREIGMPNPRNLNHVLDCVGKRLEKLSDAWGEAIPRIQAAVINRSTGLPSEGVGWFFEGEARERFEALPIPERKRLLYSKWAEIYDYQKWGAVLDAVGLKPVDSVPADIVKTAAKIGATSESRGSFFWFGCREHSPQKP